MTGRPAWSDEDLRQAVATSVSWRQVAQALGKTFGGNTSRSIRAGVDRLGLDTSHFLGRSWNKGQGKGRDPERQRIANQRWYNDHKQVYLDRNKLRRDQRREALQDLKRRPCMDCGVEYPSFVMDFDHRDDQDKCGDIARMILNAPWERILEEITKCDLVCANCHRFRTARRAGRWPE